MLIQDNQLENVYKDDINVFTNSVNSQFNEVSEVQDTTIQMYAKDNSSVLCYPIIREYHKSKTFYSDISKSGKVAVHKLFKLLSDYRSKGIAKHLHEKELAIYKLNKFEEIQLDAAWDGVIVWRKLLFEYVDAQEEKKIKKSIVVYLQVIKGLTTKEVAIEVDRPLTSIKSSLLKREDDKPSFTEWYLDNMSNLHLIRMYKKI